MPPPTVPALAIAIATTVVAGPPAGAYLRAAAAAVVLDAVDQDPPVCEIDTEERS